MLERLRPDRSCCLLASLPYPLERAQALGGADSVRLLFFPRSRACARAHVHSVTCIITVNLNLSLS